MLRIFKKIYDLIRNPKYKNSYVIFIAEEVLIDFFILIFKVQKYKLEKNNYSFSNKFEL